MADSGVMEAVMALTAYETWRCRSRSAGWIAMLVASVVTLLIAAWFGFGWGGPQAVRWADDLGCAAASGLAAVLCWRVSRSSPQTRESWRLLAMGAGSWTAGQVVWCIYDLGFDKVPSMPAFDDIGYLAFPVFAILALIRLPATATDRTWLRWGLDGVLVAVSGLLLVWSTIVEPTGNTDAALPTIVVAIAYPMSDVVLLTVSVLVSLHLRVGRARLLVVAFALAWLAMADALFSYLSVTGSYEPGVFSDVAYIAAFGLLAAATFIAPGEIREADKFTVPESLRGALPYVPFGVAGLVALARSFVGHPLDEVDVALWLIATTCILGRQALVLSDNRRLLGTVRAQHEQMAVSAMTDTLTGLANRAVFTDRVRHATVLHARDMRQVSLAWIDLDDFKLVNDTAGHAAGDELLIKVAERLRGAVRLGDTVARLGGDEFAVLVEDGSDAAALGERICGAMRQPFSVDGAQRTVTASVGIAVLRPEDSHIDPAELVSRADIAMYSAKHAGKNQIAMYQPSMTVPGASDALLRDPLRRAVANDDIAVFYQPLLFASDGRLGGFEALARWKWRGHPVNPEEFVALADRVGLGCALGDRILYRALTQSMPWIGEHEDLVIGINLAPSQVADPSFPDRVARVLRGLDVPPAQVVFEITEAALLTDSNHALETAHRLVDMGIKLSLDDFGTGYSSLAHLRRLPLSSVKIDRSFVTSVEHDDAARSFVAAVMRLSEDLGFRTVVEGIESAGELEVIRELGATYVQGYLFDPPRPSGEIDIRKDWSAFFASQHPTALPRQRSTTEATLAV